MKNKRNKKVPGQRRRLKGDSIQAITMLAPMMLGFVIFTYVPIVYILRYSLYQSNGFRETWIGLDNFVRVFTRDPAFWKSIVNVFILSIGKLAVEIPLALLLAVLLGKGIQGIRFFSGAFFPPAHTTIHQTAAFFFPIVLSFKWIIHGIL